MRRWVERATPRSQNDGVRGDFPHREPPKRGQQLPRTFRSHPEGAREVFAFGASSKVARRRRARLFAVGCWAEHEKCPVLVQGVRHGSGRSRRRSAVSPGTGPRRGITERTTPCRVLHLLDICVRTTWTGAGAASKAERGRSPSKAHRIWGK